MLTQDALHNPPQGWDRRGLPGWTYFNEELYQLEQEALFRRQWQLACHISDIPDPGDFITFDIADERALIVRGKDGVVRAFHNLCRHRGSRVVASTRGHCKHALTCPYHGWAFGLDGHLIGPAKPGSFPDLDKVEWGLKSVEMEIWQGFVFVRFKPSAQPSVARILARFEAEVALYNPEIYVPSQGAAPYGETAVNWKSVRDVDNEGYHVPKAHPGLQDLYGHHYIDEPFVEGASRSVGVFNKTPNKIWSVRAYRNLLPEPTWLPESHRDAWLYIGLFPNTVMSFYPDSINFYQDLPDGVGNTKLRGGTYRHCEESRALRAARYLSARIDRITSDEDQMLTIWSCEAARSSGYDGIILSDLEYGVKTYHDHLRALLPVYKLEEEPARGTLPERNRALAA